MGWVRGNYRRIIEMMIPQTRKGTLRWLKFEKMCIEHMVVFILLANLLGFASRPV